MSAHICTQHTFCCCLSCSYRGGCTAHLWGDELQRRVLCGHSMVRRPCFHKATLTIASATIVGTPRLPPVREGTRGGPGPRDLPLARCSHKVTAGRRRQFSGPWTPTTKLQHRTAHTCLALHRSAPERPGRRGPPPPAVFPAQAHGVQESLTGACTQPVRGGHRAQESPTGACALLVGGADSHRQRAHQPPPLNGEVTCSTQGLT